MTTSKPWSSYTTTRGLPVGAFEMDEEDEDFEEAFEEAQAFKPSDLSDYTSGVLYAV